MQEQKKQNQDQALTEYKNAQAAYVNAKKKAENLKETAQAAKKEVEEKAKVVEQPPEGSEPADKEKAQTALEEAKIKYQQAKKAAETAENTAKELEAAAKGAEPEKVSKLKKLIQKLSAQYNYLESYGSSPDEDKNYCANMAYVDLGLLLGREPDGARKIVGGQDNYKNRKYSVEDEYTKEHSIKDWVDGKNLTAYFNRSQLTFVKEILVIRFIPHVRRYELGPTLFGQAKHAVGVSTPIQKQFQELAETLVDIIITGLDLLPKSEFKDDKIRIINAETYPKLMDHIKTGHTKWLEKDTEKLEEDWKEGFDQNQQDQNQSISVLNA